MHGFGCAGPEFRKVRKLKFQKKRLVNHRGLCYTLPVWCFPARTRWRRVVSAGRMEWIDRGKCRERRV